MGATRTRGRPGGAEGASGPFLSAAAANIEQYNILSPHENKIFCTQDPLLKTTTTINRSICVPLSARALCVGCVGRATRCVLCLGGDALSAVAYNGRTEHLKIRTNLDRRATRNKAAAEGPRAGHAQAFSLVSRAETHSARDTESTSRQEASMLTSLNNVNTRERAVGGLAASVSTTLPSASTGRLRVANRTLFLARDSTRVYA